jgi:dihydropteroate synthase
MRIGPREFVWGMRTYLMGVLNVSPDSFSGDGLTTVDEAVDQARRFARDGADILDVGGQSTRPGKNKTEAGFDEISADEETARVVPAILAVRTAPRSPPVPTC